MLIASYKSAILQITYLHSCLCTCSILRKTTVRIHNVSHFHTCTTNT